MKNNKKQMKHFYIVDSSGGVLHKKKKFSSLHEGYEWISNYIPQKHRDFYFVVQSRWETCPSCNTESPLSLELGDRVFFTCPKCHITFSEQGSDMDEIKQRLEKLESTLEAKAREQERQEYKQKVVRPIAEQYNVKLEQGDDRLYVVALSYAGHKFHISMNNFVVYDDHGNLDVKSCKMLLSATFCHLDRLVNDVFAPELADPTIMCSVQEIYSPCELIAPTVPIANRLIMIVSSLLDSRDQLKTFLD